MYGDSKYLDNDLDLNKRTFSQGCQEVHIEHHLLSGYQITEETLL